MHSNPIDLADLCSVKDYAAKFPRILSPHTLRYQLRCRDANGLTGACVRIGKKLLISHSRYQAWLSKQAEGAIE